MKKKVVIGVLILLVSIILAVTLLNTNKREDKFYLEDNYYGMNNMMEIKIEKLNQIIGDRQSFAVFIYQPMCETSSNFESVLSKFLENNNISIYKIAFSSIKDTKIGKKVKYYPSFIIYNKGKMVDFLEANKDEDVDFYSTESEFKKWFTSYVQIKK